MLEIDIPGFGFVRLEHLVPDFAGTLSIEGKLMPGAEDLMNKIAEKTASETKPSASSVVRYLVRIYLRCCR